MKSPSPLKPGESWLQAKVQTKDKAKWVRAAQRLKQSLAVWVIETLNRRAADMDKADLVREQNKYIAKRLRELNRGADKQE